MIDDASSAMPCCRAIGESAGVGPIADHVRDRAVDARRVAAASISAARFEPRPEIRIVMRASATAKGALGLGCSRDATRQRTTACGAPSARATIAPMRYACSPARCSASIARSASLACDDEHHADAAVEDAMHLVVGDVARARCSQSKIGGRGHVDAVEPRLHAVRQHARHVLDEAAAGDVRHALDAQRLASARAPASRRCASARAARRRAWPSSARRTACARSRRSRRRRCADQRKAVRMRAARREADARRRPARSRGRR